MIITLQRIAVLLTLALAATSTSPARAQAPAKGNPMLAPWTGPYGGVPPWHLVRPEKFGDSFDAAIKSAQADVSRIAENSEPPTFENTILALENAGEDLDRLQNLFGVHSSNLNVGPIPDIERNVSPKLAEHSDWIIQNGPLFKRIEAVYKSDEYKAMSAPQQRLVEDLYKSFVRAGARLNEDEKKRLSGFNKRLAILFTEFSQNVLEEEKGHVTWIENKEQLAGLPASIVSAMAAAAKERGKDGMWAVTNTRSSMDPFLTYAANRELRKKVWTNYYSRGDNGDSHDNNAIISEILKIRAKRAKLLGYETHAHWRLERTMAKNPEATMNLMMRVWPKAVARVKEEVAEMQGIADQEGKGVTIEPWDYRYYAEKVRKAKYDLDFNEVKPYMQLDKLREGMHWSAGKLYGFTFHEIKDLPIFHPDVRVWEVKGRDGQHVGLWYLDPYARVGKRSGAWMTAYRPQNRMNGSDVTPIVSNNSNFVKGQPGEPVLISWDDAVTLFHEFGHAIHGLCSNVTYRSQAGTAVARDYVEFPSQLYEHWLETPEVLNQFAVHYKTGKPIPKELVAKIRKASTFNQGFATVEYLASALIDMKLHLAGDVEIDPDKFERETLAELGMPKEIVMRHRTPHFAHIFSGDSYSAGYYSYLWSDALTADAAEAFKDADAGFYDEPTAKRLYENVMSVGDTIDPGEGFRRFRGRDVDTDALLRKRGFPVK